MSADRGEIRSLFRRLSTRHERDALGLLLLEGVSPFLQAHSAGVSFRAITHSRILLRSPAAQKLIRWKKREGVSTFHLSPEEYRELSFSSRAAGVAAVVRQRWVDLDSIEPSRGLCWVAVERIRSPGNLGTIARTAEAVGAAGLILLGGEVDPHDPAVVRASRGALFHLRLVRTHHAALYRWARRTGAHLVATSPRARSSYTELPAQGPLVLLLGDEREGLSERAFTLSSQRVRLPIHGRGDSLNVGVAAGVLLYEALRRRGAGEGTARPATEPRGSSRPDSRARR